MNFKLRYISIQSSNPDGFVDELKSINITSGYFNISEQAKEEKSMVLIIKIFLKNIVFHGLRFLLQNLDIYQNL